MDTGISAKDRATTILGTVKDGVNNADLARPGHVFPLRARDGGVPMRAQGTPKRRWTSAKLAGSSPLAYQMNIHDERRDVRLPANLILQNTISGRHHRSTSRL